MVQRGRYLKEAESKYGAAWAIAVVQDVQSGEILALADSDAMYQILVNLVDNAIKYTPEGGKVMINATTSGGAISISIADTGMGIPPEDQARIFEGFYRVD